MYFLNILSKINLFSLVFNISSSIWNKSGFFLYIIDECFIYYEKISKTKYRIRSNFIILLLKNDNLIL